MPFGLQAGFAQQRPSAEATISNSATAKQAELSGNGRDDASNIYTLVDSEDDGYTEFQDQRRSHQPLAFAHRYDSLRRKKRSVTERASAPPAHSWCAHAETHTPAFAEALPRSYLPSAQRATSGRWSVRGVMDGQPPARLLPAPPVERAPLPMQMAVFSRSEGLHVQRRPAYTILTEPEDNLLARQGHTAYLEETLQRPIAASMTGQVSTERSAGRLDRYS